MAFCQVVLKRTLVENVKNDPYDLGWAEKVAEHKKTAPADPLPFPFNDPDPQASMIFHISLVYLRLCVRFGTYSISLLKSPS